MTIPCVTKSYNHHGDGRFCKLTEATGNRIYCLWDKRNSVENKATFNEDEDEDEKIDERGIMSPQKCNLTDVDIHSCNSIMNEHPSDTAGIPNEENPHLHTTKLHENIKC